VLNFQVHLVSLWPIPEKLRRKLGKDHGLEIVANGGKVFYLATPGAIDCARIMDIFLKKQRQPLAANTANGSIAENWGVPRLNDHNGLHRRFSSEG
jgi:hypothetical protein